MVRFLDSGKPPKNKEVQAMSEKYMKKFNDRNVPSTGESNPLYSADVHSWNGEGMSYEQSMMPAAYMFPEFEPSARIEKEKKLKLINSS